MVLCVITSIGGLFLCAWCCPKEKCPNISSLNEGDKCPTCGLKAKEFGFFELKLLNEAKKNKSQESPNEPKGENKILAIFGDEGKELPSMKKVTNNLLKTIFEQNKIIIQQNKVIQKLLKKK